uniref:Uncharacterized protein n=1 Tax=Arundo donax TaxID=35708 RepID=A0A0A9D753_ARUDO
MNVISWMCYALVIFVTVSSCILLTKSQKMEMRLLGTILMLILLIRIYVVQCRILRIIIVLYIEIIPWP